MIKYLQTSNTFIINRQHFVDIKCFLSCNKIKNLGFKDAKQIANAIEQAQNLEINSEGTMLRRKDLTSLPEFQPKKKTKVDDGDGPNESVNPYNKMETYFCFNEE